MNHTLDLTPKKTLRRRLVVSGVLSGQSTKAIALSAAVTERTVQRIVAEPETQFLLTEAFRPYQKRLQKMASLGLVALEEALHAAKSDTADHASRLKAVKLYGHILKLAQGKVVEKAVEQNLQMTWEQFSAMYQARNVE